ncbi:hypothetical protein AGMMS50218_09470 [Actinomycetota bacterium]|nr:hypothetical protein AGMMS50218_09470 [Actinomycetota bacterium]
MTNITLNVAVLAVLVLVSWRVLRRLRGGALFWTVFHLCLLTMLADTAMIAADLYVFDPDKILGIYLWGAPLEDFAYAIAAALGMPVLWTVIGRRQSAHRAVRRAAAEPPDPSGSSA